MRPLARARVGRYVRSCGAPDSIFMTASGSLFSNSFSALLRRGLLLACATLVLLPAVGHAASTVVSLEFDDGWADQYANARAQLKSHGMHGTFFINSGSVGTTDYMTWQQITDLATDGNEIGGHTIDHPHLKTLSSSEQVHQICDDRTALRNRGFAVTNFAYPYGEYDATVKANAKSCGYSTARDVQ